MLPSFSFILTEKCDWTCEYCYFSLIKQYEPKLETFKKHLPYIKKTIDGLGDNINIDIQGGEIGTMPEELLEYFLTTLDRKVVFSTNGLFLNKKMHLNEKIRPYIGAICLHLFNFNQTCINEYTLSEFRGESMDEYELQGLNISRGIVHNRIDEIINVVGANKHILFDYIELEFDIRYPRKIDTVMYHDLIGQLSEFENVTDNAMGILKKRIFENENHRDRCRKFNNSIVIDMVNSNICLCQRQPDIAIPLTEEDLIYRLKTFPKDIDGWQHNNMACDSCTRLYSGKGVSIKNTLKNRKTL
jgi:hypothetical protein